MEFEDASGFRGTADRAFAPSDETELASILREASSKGVPVTIAGGWTGVTGGAVPQGGWSVSMARFSRLDIAPGRAIAGSGTLLRDLHSAARGSGQLYPPDPTETAAAIGGTIACNASGSRSFRYGATRRWVERLRMVLMDGSVVETRRGDKIDFDVSTVCIPTGTKHSAGYPLEPAMDLVDLIVGSEGTLAVVTEAELRLIPATEGLLTGVVFFADVSAALSAVDDWRGVEGLRMIEFMDGPSLDLLRDRYSELPATASAALLIEQEGEGEVDAWADRLAAAEALEESWFGTSDGDRERFRVFRHALPERVNDTVRRNGFTKLGSDYSVPVSRAKEMYRVYRERLEAEFAGRFVIFGHAGDAHLHANILPVTADEFERGRVAMVDFARAAVSMGGSVAAEHGLGKRKAHLLALQYTPAEIASMKDVKRRFDPQWLLGRGNLLGARQSVTVTM